MQIQCVDYEVEFGHEFLDGSLDGARCLFAIALAGHNLSGSLPQIFKRNVFVLSDLGNVCIYSMAIVENR